MSQIQNHWLVIKLPDLVRYHPSFKSHQTRKKRQFSRQRSTWVKEIQVKRSFLCPVSRTPSISYMDLLQVKVQTIGCWGYGTLSINIWIYCRDVEFLPLAWLFHVACHFQLRLTNTFKKINLKPAFCLWPNSWNCNEEKWTCWRGLTPNARERVFQD